MKGSQGGESNDSTRQLIVLEVEFLKSIAESKHKLAQFMSVWCCWLLDHGDIRHEYWY